MFFEDEKQIPKLIAESNFSIFLLPKTLRPTINYSLMIEPDEKNKVGIDQVKELMSRCSNKQGRDFIILINQAEKMNTSAQNALLKFLEEPKNNYHIVMFVNSYESLLPTVLSRANLYFLRESGVLNQAVIVDEKIKNYAKKLLTSSGNELVQLCNAITKDSEYKKQDNARNFVISICQTAIELAYKSFFATEKTIFLKKLENLILLEENLSKNGNIKLHLIADLC